MPNEENSPAGSFPEVRLSAAAAVKYINGNLGGVNGHPLKLDTCITDATPATSANCANQFVKDKALAVTTGIDFGSAASLPILSKAGIPVLGVVPTGAADFTTPGVFAFGSGTVGGAPATMSYFVNNLKIKKFSIIYLDTPSGQQAAIVFCKNVLKKLGVTDVSLIPAAATLSDYTAPVQQANASNPGLIAVLEPASICSRIMLAKQSIGVKADMFYTESCDGAAVTKAGGAGANNAYFTSEVLAPTSDDPQVATYAAVMKKYAAGTDLSSFSETGFATVMNTYALLKTLPASGMTSAALLAAVKKTVNQPNFLGHPYTCDGRQIPGFPSVCSTYERVLQYQNGKLQDVLGSWISGAKYLG